MLNKELSVVIKCGYQEVAESNDPALCAQVLALVAQHKDTPETPEQRLIRELKDAADTADTRRYEEKQRADRLEKQVAELVAKVDAMRVAATLPKMTGPVPVPEF